MTVPHPASGTACRPVIGGLLGDEFGLRPTLGVYAAMLLLLAFAGPLVIRFSRLDATLELPTDRKPVTATAKEPTDGHP